MVTHNQCDFQGKNKKGLDNYTQRMHKKVQKFTKEVEYYADSAHETEDEDKKLKNKKNNDPR